MLRKTPKYERIAFVASPAPEARKALSGEPAKQRQFDEFAKALGIEG